MSRGRQQANVTPPRSSRSITPSQARFSELNTSQYQEYIAYIPKEKFDPKDYLIAGTTEKDIEIYKEIFDFMDSNSNGVLQPMDLRNAMKISGYHPTKPQIYQILSDFDTDESGIIEFREFVKMMTIKPCENDTEDDIRKVFEQIDFDCNDCITRENIRELAEDHQEELTDDQIDAMIKECDPDGNGVIRWQAFLKFNKRRVF